MVIMMTIISLSSDLKFQCYDKKFPSYCPLACDCALNFMFHKWVAIESGDCLSRMINDQLSLFLLNYFRLFIHNLEIYTIRYFSIWEWVWEWMSWWTYVSSLKLVLEHACVSWWQMMGSGECLIWLYV